MNIKCQTTW